MDDFDRRLEIELAHLLDPIVDAPVPQRRRHHVNLRSIEGGLDLARAPEITVVHEPMPAVAPLGTTS